jgi:predicted nucleic acid-binding Zn ribbon protein
MNMPVDVQLHLDVRKLPARTFERFTKRSLSLRLVRERSEQAWYNFGKPGRDPNSLAGVVSGIVQREDWTPHLKIAQLRNHWDEIVGPAIAQHSYVLGYQNGELTIRSESTVWATQLTYLVPQLTKTIAQKLSDLPVEKIVVTGPHSQSFRKSRFSSQGRGGRVKDF